MTTKELIRAEIERRIEAIANAPSDNGVMDSINGAKGHELMTLLSFLDTLPDEPVTDCHDLTEAAKKSARQYYVDGGYSPFPNTEMASHIAGFKAGAEWQKRKMMEGAVEGVVWWQVGKNISIRVLKGACKYLEQDDLPYKVRIIILPKEGER